MELIRPVFMWHFSSQHLKQLHTVTHMRLQCLPQGTPKTQQALKKKTCFTALFPSFLADIIHANQHLPTSPVTCRSDAPP